MHCRQRRLVTRKLSVCLSVRLSVCQTHDLWQSWSLEADRVPVERTRSSSGDLSVVWHQATTLRTCRHSASIHGTDTKLRRLRCHKALLVYRSECHRQTWTCRAQSHLRIREMRFRDGWRYPVAPRYKWSTSAARVTTLVAVHNPNPWCSIPLRSRQHETRVPVCKTTGLVLSGSNLSETVCVIDTWLARSVTIVRLTTGADRQFSVQCAVTSRGVILDDMQAEKVGGQRYHSTQPTSAFQAGGPAMEKALMMMIMHNQAKNTHHIT